MAPPGVSGRRIGVLTGGGDCPGLNAVMRAVVQACAPDVSVLGIVDAFSGLVDPDRYGAKGNRWLEPADVRELLMRGGTILGTTNRGDPFRFPVKDEAGEHLVDLSERVVERVRTLGLEGLVVIGGDGTMRIARRLMERGVPILGVPKTIDNDLGVTEQTFGFDTAVSIATESIDRLRDTAESHDRVMLIEVMGRGAGFIALHAGLAGGADAILLPEIPYRLEPLLALLRRRFESGQGYAIVVVSEGAVPEGGDASVTGQALGGMPRLGGAARRLEEALSPLTTAEIRTTVLGHVQRGGSPTAFDRVLATRYGAAAGDLAVRGAWNAIVALRHGEIVPVPLATAALEPRRVDPRSELVTTARRIGVVFGDWQ